MLARADGTFVNWDADIFTIVPGLEGRYRQRFGPVTVELTSAFKYFRSWPIRRSTEALSFESESKWWRNELDVDLRLPLYAFGRQFRTRRSPPGPSCSTASRTRSGTIICTTSGVGS